MDHDAKALAGEKCQPAADGAKDILLAWYKEHADQSRQHENQRERMTALVIGVGAGALGLAAIKVEGVSPRMLAGVLIILGMYGALFSYKHYERNRRHVEMMKEIGGRLRTLYPQAEMEDIKKSAKQNHSKRFSRIERVPLHLLWVGLPLMVSVLGFVLLIGR